MFIKSVGSTGAIESGSEHEEEGAGLFCVRLNHPPSFSAQRSAAASRSASPAYLAVITGDL